MKIKVEVTQADIDAAVAATSHEPHVAINHCCPVAQAMSRQFGGVLINCFYAEAKSELATYTVMQEDEEAMIGFTCILPEEWSIRCKPATLQFWVRENAV